jgi:hypothetical protein
MRKRWWTAGLAGIAVAMAAAAAAQMPPHAGPGGPGAMKHGHGAGPPSPVAVQPTMPGQDAFGTIQEIVRMLEADPATDWSKVNIAALREHLIDMNEVTLHAAASEQARADGVEIAVTGEGRILAAIRRMVPAHARELAHLGWSARTEERPDGVTLIVTSPHVAEAAKLRSLGFMGIMVAGGHHQPHHLMIARGELAVH